MKQTICLLCLCVSACGGGVGQQGDGSSGPSPSPIAVTAADMQYCIDVMNSYRARIGRPPMTGDARLAQIATNAAKQDYLARVPHQHFNQTNGEGYALAENEFPGIVGPTTPSPARLMPGSNRSGTKARVEGTTRT